MIKIGPYLPKLLQEKFGAVFLAHPVEVVRLAQRMFGFGLPSFLIEKRSNKFYMVK